MIHHRRIRNQSLAICFPLSAVHSLDFPHLRASKILRVEATPTQHQPLFWWKGQPHFYFLSPLFCLSQYPDKSIWKGKEKAPFREMLWRDASLKLPFPVRTPPSLLLPWKASPNKGHWVTKLLAPFLVCFLISPGYVIWSRNLSVLDTVNLQANTRTYKAENISTFSTLQSCPPVSNAPRGNHPTFPLSIWHLQHLNLHAWILCKKKNAWLLTWEGVWLFAADWQ